MPDPVTAAVITAAGILGSSAVNSVSASKSAKASKSANQEALAFAREQEESRRREYEEQQRRLDQYYQAEQARRAPYRQASLGVLAKYGYAPTAAPADVRPPDWQPGMTQPAPRGMVDFSGLGLGRERPVDVTPPVPLGGYGGLG